MSEPHAMTLLQRRVIAMVGANAFASALLISTVNVALPAIAADLTIDATLLNWVPLIFLTASATFVLPFARLSDHFGRRRVFLMGIVGVSIASVCAALAESATMLIAMRFLQGICAAGGFVTVISIVSAALPIKVRGRAFGIIASLMYLGLTLGPVLGGFVVDHYGWRWTFVIQIPVSLYGLWIGWLRIDEEWLGPRYGSFDFAGAFISGAAIITLSCGVVYLPSLLGVAAMVASVAAIAGFVVLESRLREPLFNVRLFQTHTTFAFSCAAAFLMYAATFSNVVLMSLYLQYLKAMSAQAAGLVLLVQPLAIALTAPIAGRLSDKFEPRFVASVGIALTGIGLALLAVIDTVTGLNFIIPSLALSGVGFALFAPVNANAVMSSVEPAHYGMAAGAHACLRVVGQMLSMIVVTLIFALLIGRVQMTPASYAGLGESIRLSFWVMVLLCIPAAYFSLNRGNLRGPEAAHNASMS